MSNDPKPSKQSPAHRIRSAAAYWFQLIAQPVLAVAFVVALAWLFGYLQRTQSWFNDAASTTEVSEKRDAQYACSMLCVFVSAPGRCPVCGMELQEIETTGDPKDVYGLRIEPTARRLANIETVVALPEPVSKNIQVLGRVEFDETSVSLISAYVDGRIEELFVDFTGAKVSKGDELAVIYSPDLYSDQVGLRQAKAATQTSSGNARVDEANRRLYASARRRLIEQGVPESQVDNFESAGSINSRIKIYSPQSGTVVEKLIKEGTYIKTGTPILKIADLSTVWLILEMYPEDAADLVLGQLATVNFQSQVGTSFEGRVSFVDPNVDANTRTVRVRVSIPNDAGLLKIGDLGKATIAATGSGALPRVIVPRTAVLMNGSNSIAYVETEPGRFEFRQVTIAEMLGDRVSIVDGIEPGEQVVASGTFMLDSTFNIQGKASLIDPKRAATSMDESAAMEMTDDSESEDLPQMSLPDEDLPQMELPSTDVPQMEPPQGALPEMQVPDAGVAEAELPQMQLPGEEPSEMELPEMEVPR